MEDVLAKGLKNAKNAILAGSSAGGYPAMLYCDRFRSLLPNTPRVKCFVDAGYFIHAKNQKQARGFEDIYNTLVTLHVNSYSLLILLS
nr:pectin acetylesterase 7-like [Nicotiana tomentosiformis]